MQSRDLIIRLADALRQIPGVTGVTNSQVPLLGGSNWGTDVNVEGFPTGPDVDNNSRYNEVGPGYFSTLRVPLLIGREFTVADGFDAPNVAVANQAFARKFARRQSRRPAHGSGQQETGCPDRWAREGCQVQPGQGRSAASFVSSLQDSLLGLPCVRTSLDPEIAHSADAENGGASRSGSSAGRIAHHARADPAVVFVDRFISIFSAALAGPATLLAAVGLYGVLAFTVAQRTREFGLRMALGAAPRQVLLLILRQVGMMTLVGGVIGIAAAVALGRVSQSLLFQMQGYDPEVLILSAITIAVVATGAARPCVSRLTRGADASLAVRVGRPEHNFPPHRYGC